MEKIKTPEQAREHIESQSIKIKVNTAYNLYSCGHVVMNKKDPLFNITKNRKSFRCCPECMEGRFVTKYKKCGQNSKGCERESLFRSYIKDGPCLACRKHKKSVVKVKKPAVKHMPSRDDCTRRSDCVNGWAFVMPLVDALPCSECGGYVR